MVLFVCTLSFAVEPTIDSAQDETASAEYTLYQIKMSHIERMLKQNPNVKADILAEVRSLMQDAVLLADERMYDIAAEYLENVISLLEQPMVQTLAISGVQYKKPSSSLKWDFIAFTGSEYWQQKFGLVFNEKDSTITDEQTNPHGGLRVYLDFEKGEAIQSQMQIELKSSQEYNSASIYLEHYQKFTNKFRGVFKNASEKTSYKQNTELSFFDNSFEAGFYYQPIEKLVFSLDDEFELRKYNIESEYFSNYKQNRLQLSAETRIPDFGRLKVGGERRFRKYGLDALRDYDEPSLNAQLWPDLYTRFSLTDMFRYRTRQYVHGYIDSLYTNNFSDIYNLADLRYTLFGDTRFMLEFEVESRAYETITSSIPDYLDYNVEPGFETGLGDYFTLQLGYRFRNKLHDIGGETDESVQIEDFYSHGPVFTLDIMMMNGFLASISNSYQAQRYPNYTSYDYSGLSLYSNRNINSFFFYLSWDLTSSIEINGMGMIDYDTDQELEGANTISNLLNFELLYKF